MNNSKCSVCGTPFEMGVSGIFAGKVEKCDSCAGVVRLANGERYEANRPYEMCRSITSAYLNAAGPRPGDFIVVHPNRKASR